MVVKREFKRRELLYLMSCLFLGILVLLFSVSILLSQQMLSKLSLFDNYENIPAITPSITMRIDLEQAPVQNQISGNVASDFSLDGQLPSPPPIDLGGSSHNNSNFSLDGQLPSPPPIDLGNPDNIEGNNNTLTNDSDINSSSNNNNNTITNVPSSFASYNSTSYPNNNSATNQTPKGIFDYIVYVLIALLSIITIVIIYFYIIKKHSPPKPQLIISKDKSSQLQAYIMRCRAAGFSDQEIENKFIISGYKKEDFEKFFNN